MALAGAMLWTRCPDRYDVSGVLRTCHRESPGEFLSVSLVLPEQLLEKPQRIPTEFQDNSYIIPTNS